MKIHLLTITLLCLGLSACGDEHGHGHVHAVDAIEEAQTAALAKAPKADPIKFDDEHLPRAGSTTQTATTDAPSSDTASDATATPTTDTTNTNDGNPPQEQPKS